MIRQIKEERVIVALDVPTVDEAVALVRALDTWVCRFKIGLELYMAAGPEAVQAVQWAGAQRKRIFLDIKLHDTPETVRRAARMASLLGAEFITVHASGGVAMMRAAVEGAHERGGANILAVTVLTSLNDQAARHSYGAPAREAVLRFATDAEQGDCWGIICSPQELAYLRDDQPLKRLQFITPGVRPTWALPNDQARVMTPAEAIQHGAHAVVVGRPVTQPPAEVGSPADAVRRIISELPERR